MFTEAEKLRLKAAESWLELGDWHAANEELEEIDAGKRGTAPVLVLRCRVHAVAGKWEVARDIGRLVGETPSADAEVVTLEWLIERNRRNGADEVPRRLETLCLDPSTRLSDTSPRYFAGLRSALVLMMKKRTTAIRTSSVTTEIGTKIRSAFEFSRRTRSLVIVQGEARMGKTFAARAWCEENLSSARFAQVPSTGDEIGFYRAIAKSLGVSINLNSKAQELRNRIEEVLQTGHLLLCLDEAHYLWPQTNYRDAHPQRINWLMTALTNHGVPVVLVVTPQFFRHQQRIEHRTCWTSEQFTGRVSRFIDLPKSLPRSDLVAVARHCLPGIGEDYIRALAGLAASSAKYLGAIDATVKAARFFAEEDGRTEPSDEDVARAMAESTIPSDNALMTALQEGLPTAAAAVRPPLSRAVAATRPERCPAAAVARPFLSSRPRETDFRPYPSLSAFRTSSRSDRQPSFASTRRQRARYPFPSRFGAWSSVIPDKFSARLQNPRLRSPSQIEGDRGKAASPTSRCGQHDACRLA